MIQINNEYPEFSSCNITLARGTTGLIKSWVPSFKSNATYPGFFHKVVTPPPPQHLQVVNCNKC